MQTTYIYNIYHAKMTYICSTYNTHIYSTYVCIRCLRGLFFGIFFLLNLCIWGEKSSGAVPFTTLFAILVLWCPGDKYKYIYLISKTC